MTTDTATLSQSDCDVLLAAEHPSLRRVCSVFGITSEEQRAVNRNKWSWVTTSRTQDHAVEHEEQPGMLSCHGHGYVPRVELEALMVAMEDVAAFKFWPGEDDARWAWTAILEYTLPSTFAGYADTLLLALSRAACAATVPA